MALIHRFGERVGNPGAHADHRRLVDTELHGDRIRRLEADAADVAREAIGVFGHDLHGVGAVGLEDADRAGGAHAIAVQEHHDLPHDLLLGPGAGDQREAPRADAGHLAQPIGLNLDDIKHFFAERLDHLRGVDRADAADHPRSEVFFDAFDCCRRRAAHEARLELLTVRAVVDPFTRRGDPLAGRDSGGVPDRSHQFAVTTRLDAQNAEAILGIVISDAFDKPRENFPGR